MKHVFVVHSNITYLAALGVICKKNIDEKDVLIISETYEIDAPIKCKKSKINYSIREAVRHPYRYFNPVKKCDRYIQQLTNGECYIAYITVFFDLQQIIVTNHLCKGFNFIEEGISVYCNKIPLSLSVARVNQFRQWRNGGVKSFVSDVLKLIKGYNLKLQSLPFLYNAYFNTENVHFYGFDDKSYYGVNDLERISLREVSQKFTFKKTRDYNNYDIWISTCVVDVINYPLEDYLYAIENGCIKLLKSEGKSNVLIKFHPSESKLSRDGVLELFRKHTLDVEVIQDSVVMEIELMGTKGVTLWGVDSSLMFYATKASIKCNSVVKFMRNYPIMDAVVYWKEVTMIDNGDESN